MAILDSDDRLVQRLRALPPYAPDASLDALVVQAGFDALTGRQPGSSDLGFFGRIVLPAFLSLTTLSYLWWALSAASALYL